MVAQADSTLAAIEKKVRRLTASPSTSMLSEDDLDEYINAFYSQDFPSSLKVEQLKKVYDIYTTPNVDTYTIPKNTYQALSGPVYVNGYQARLYKDRNEFYSDWPKLNGPSAIAGTGDGATLVFPFTLTAIPFLRNSVILTVLNTSGVVAKIIDNGTGGFQTTDGTAVTGSINYTTGVSTITFDAGTTGTPALDAPINVSVVQYSASRPIGMLYWQNELIVRPVPDNVYKISVEAYQTPTQFLASGDSPELSQWWQLIACGAALRILQDRQDQEGIQAVREVYEEQRGLALERQATNHIGQRTGTIYSQNEGNFSSFLGVW